MKPVEGIHFFLFPVVVPAVGIVKERSGLRRAPVTSCRSPLGVLITLKSERSNVSTQ